MPRLLVYCVKETVKKLKFKQKQNLNNKFLIWKKKVKKKKIGDRYENLNLKKIKIKICLESFHCSTVAFLKLF